MDSNKQSLHRNTPFLICLGLVVIIVLIYARVASFDFIYCDDDQYVFQNPIVRQGITFEGAKWALTRSHAANWHPLTWLMLNCSD